MGDFKINEKTVFSQSGSDEPAMGSTVTGIPAAGVTGVLPVAVTGGSGLTHLASNPTVTLGSNATFPAGHIRQVKNADLTALAEGSSATLWGGAVSFASAILATSDVLLFVSGVIIDRHGNDNNRVAMYFTGGGLGADTSGHKLFDYYFSYHGLTHRRVPFSGQTLDTAPASTTPSYQMYCDRGGSDSSEIALDSCVPRLTLMEVISS